MGKVFNVGFPNCMQVREYIAQQNFEELNRISNQKANNGRSFDFTLPDEATGKMWDDLIFEHNYAKRNRANYEDPFIVVDYARGEWEIAELHHKIFNSVKPNDQT